MEYRIYKKGCFGKGPAPTANYKHMSPVTTILKEVCVCQRTKEEKHQSSPTTHNTSRKGPTAWFDISNTIRYECKTQRIDYEDITGRRRSSTRRCEPFTITRNFFPWQTTFQQVVSRYNTQTPTHISHIFFFDLLLISTTPFAA